MAFRTRLVVSSSWAMVCAMKSRNAAAVSGVKVGWLAVDMNPPQIEWMGASLGNWQPPAGCRDNFAVVILAPRAGICNRESLTGCWLCAEHCLLHRHGRKPVVAVGHGAMDDPEELLLDRTCDRSESTLANANLVHRADRSDLRRGAGKEDLVGQVKHFAGDHLLNDRDIQVARDLDNGIARDSRQNRVAQGSGHERALAEDEQVLARALADVAVGVKRNAFGIAVENGLHLDELRVHVVCGALGHGRQGVGGNT